VCKARMYSGSSQALCRSVHKLKGLGSSSHALAISASPSDSRQRYIASCMLDVYAYDPTARKSPARSYYRLSYSLLLYR